MLMITSIFERKSYQTDIWQNCSAQRWFVYSIFHTFLFYYFLLFYMWWWNTWFNYMSELNAHRRSLKQETIAALFSKTNILLNCSNINWQPQLPFPFFIILLFHNYFSSSAKNVIATKTNDTHLSKRFEEGTSFWNTCIA